MAINKVRLHNIAKRLLNENIFQMCRKYYLKTFEPYSRLSHAYLELSTVCNLDCLMCSLKGNLKERGTMSLETFKKLENALPGLKSISLHCNGEPLVNRDIIEILSFARKTNPRLDISFSTNGMLLNPALSAHLLREGLDGISISLDGARKQTYEKIRRGACFEKVIENISDFIEQKKKIGNRIRKIGITAVASKENVHELPDILELAHRLGANYFKVNGLVPHKRPL